MSGDTTYFCNKCGYFGAEPVHTGCDYLASEVGLETRLLREERDRLIEERDRLGTRVGRAERRMKARADKWRDERKSLLEAVHLAERILGQYALLAREGATAELVTRLGRLIVVTSDKDGQPVVPLQDLEEQQ